MWKLKNKRRKGRIIFMFVGNCLMLIRLHWKISKRYVRISSNNKKRKNKHIDKKMLSKVRADYIEEPYHNEKMN